MYIKLKKLIALKIIILFQLYPNIFAPNIFSYASTSETKPTVKYLKNIPKDNFYILGPGDQIHLKVSKLAKELDSVFIINGQGVANLKRLNNIYVEGLTIKELRILLNEEYSKYVINPNVELEILRYRPIKVYIDGEVESPGQYIINGSFTLANNYRTEECPRWDHRV